MASRVSKRQLFNAHSSPTQTTPDKPVKKRMPLDELELLKPTRQSPKQWTGEEEKALVEFISLSKLDHEFGEWPYMKGRSNYWNEAATSVNKVGSRCRTGNACRQHTVEGENSLKAKYGTLENAERKFDILQIDIPVFINSSSADSQSQSVITPSYIRIRSTDLPPLSLLTSPEVLHMQSSGDKSVVIQQLFSSMNENDQLSLLLLLITTTDPANLMPITELSFKSLLTNHDIINQPNDYIELSIDAMITLQNNKEDNVPYELVKCIGLKKDDGTPRMPLDRMPYPMLSYTIRFFNCASVHELKCPKIYLQWLETMHANLGERFVQLYRGPYWSGIVAENRHPLNARVNIPAVGIRRLEAIAKESEFKADTSLQTSALQQLQQSSPGRRMWIKADGTDLHTVLQESKRQLWHGDVDLADGKLEILYSNYVERRSRLNSLAKPGNNMNRVYQTWLVDLEEDKIFLKAGETKACEKFNKKQDDTKTAESTLMRLSWEVHEFKVLNQMCENYIRVTNRYLQQINEEDADNGPVIAAVRDELTEMFNYLRHLFKKKRDAASHVLVFMIADEDRNTKPYAIPVRYLLYESLTDKTYQHHMNQLKRAMVEIGLKPIGSVTDGEFNSCRYNGLNGKPTSIFKLRMMAKDKVARLRAKSLLAMLITTEVNNDGLHVVERTNDAIPQATIQLMDELLNRGWQLKDVLSHIRQNQFPQQDYVPYSWRPNTPESLTDMLKSVICQYEYTALVAEHSTDELSFHMNAYIPEFDEDTHDFYHDREDHNHIIKRIAQHTREGGPEDINLQAFKDALEDQHTGLSYAAFKGLRKQSVEDAERLLSFAVADFMDEKGYGETARYVRTIAAWHEASDGRGLSQIQRQKYNFQMLNFILEDLMPWYQDVYDFGTIDINKPLKGIKGLSRESLIAIVTNIESQEFRRRQIACDNLNPEHPRAGTTDDVECFFSMVRRKLGDSFTHKQFKCCWRAMCREFCKKASSDLPFHYCTLSTRYTTEQEPNFDDEDETERLHTVRLRARDDGAVFSAGRAYLPVRNNLSVRARFHRTALNLPPPPGYEGTQEHRY